MGLFQRKNNIIGLVIDDEEIKAVEFIYKGNELKLHAWGRVPLTDKEVKEGVIVQPDGVSRLLLDLWSKHNFSGREVITGVANQAVLVRFAEVPKIPANKMAGFIKFHAKEYLPVALEEVVWDYSIIGENLDDDSSHWQLLLVAARRTMLNGLIGALETAQLQPRDIEVVPLSLLHLLKGVEKNQVVAMLDISSGMNNMVIADCGVPRFARMMSRNLPESYDLVAATAEQGIGANENKDEIRCMVGDIINSIGYYQSQKAAKRVEKLMLSGKNVLNRNLVSALEEALNMPVMVVDPWKAIDFSVRDNVDATGLDTEFSLCISLALSGLEGIDQ